jgi:hypothetical protein
MPVVSTFPRLFCDPSFSADPLPKSFLARPFSSELLEPEGPTATPAAFGVPEAAESDDTLFLEEATEPPSIAAVTEYDADIAWDAVLP